MYMCVLCYCSVQLWIHFICILMHIPLHIWISVFEKHIPVDILRYNIYYIYVCVAFPYRLES